MTKHLFPASLAIATALFLSAVAPAALWAQDSAPSQTEVNKIDKRVNTLERQMRAVQREVFPGGDKRFFAPEVAPEPTSETALPGAPASNPLVDLNQRVQALEEQQRALTGQIEELQFRFRQLQDASEKARADTEFRLNALEGGDPPADPASAPAAIPDLAQPTAPDPPQPAAPEAAPDPFAPATAPTPAPMAAPEAAVASQDAETSSTSRAEAGEAAYRAAFAQYQGGDDAGAIQAFADFLNAYPGHARSSHASYWSGRAQMRQDQPAQAAKTFLQTYQQYGDGPRAPNALLWLGKALTSMNRPEAACQALDELRNTYSDRMNGALLREADAARAAAKCGV